MTTEAQYDTAQEGPFWRVRPRGVKTSGTDQQGNRAQAGQGTQAAPGPSRGAVPQPLADADIREVIRNKTGIAHKAADAYSRQMFGRPYAPIGAGKLELLARNIMLIAHRLGVTPETARDLLLTGKAYAGKAEGGEVGHYADGGAVEPDKDTMLASLMLHKTPDSVNIKDVGVNEAPDLPIKAFVSPNGGSGEGLPIGGVDFQPLTPGNQIMPMQPGQPQGGLPPPPGQSPAPAGQSPAMPGQSPAPPPRPGAPQSNILAMTPQGQAMQAMRPNPQAMPRMARGGEVSRKTRGGSTNDIELEERPL